MAKRVTKADLQEALNEAEHARDSLQARVDRLGNQIVERDAKIKTLKSIARNYKDQRDQVNAYLNAIIDLTIADDEPEKSCPELREVAHFSVPPPPNGKKHRLLRPKITEPEFMPDDPYGYSGRQQRSGTHWEDL
jgi:hypothetical protein